jgi:anti-anti-sigma factor
MAREIPRGSVPVADRKDFMCVEDIPGYVHVLVGWHSRCKLDGQAAEKLLLFVSDVIKDRHKPSVLLDFSNVAYMNSQAVGTIAVKIVRLVRDAGGDLTICNPEPWVKHLLATLHLDEVLPVVEKLPEPA